MNAAPHLSQLQIRHSSVLPSQQFQSHMDHQTSSVLQIAYHSPHLNTSTNQRLSPSNWTMFSSCPVLLITEMIQLPSLYAIIQDGMVTMQQVQGRQGQSYVGTSYKVNATSFGRNNAGGQTRVVKCYNCQGEGHMARQCTQPKRPRNAAWFKEKVMLAEAQESEGQAAQTTIPNTPAFQTEDLDAYGSNYDDVSNAKAVLMANLSNYGSDVDVLSVPEFGGVSWPERNWHRSFMVTLINSRHNSMQANSKR
ncbi:retrovirus-related pol polyprotein from transposon TNT 1-94 [Tanacetum coccineum]